MASARVTVVTAVRNGAPTLTETVESILAQTIEDWEYVIVDDASTDATPDIIAGLVRRDPRIRTIRRTTSGGPYAAANDGVEAAKTQHIARIDADDVALPNRLERQLEHLRTPGGRACSCWWRPIDLQGRPSGDPVKPMAGTRALKWVLCVRQGLAHSTALIEREALLGVGGYEPLPMSQDLRLWCALSRLDWLSIVPEVLMEVRRPGGITGAAAERQEALALDVLGEHLRELTSAPWSVDEVRALRPGGGSVSLSQQLRSAERWERAWLDDELLQSPDRRELASVTRTVYTSIAKRALRTRPGSRESWRAIARASGRLAASVGRGLGV